MTFHPRAGITSCAMCMFTPLTGETVIKFHRDLEGRLVRTENVCVCKFNRGFFIWSSFLTNLFKLTFLRSARAAWSVVFNLHWFRDSWTLPCTSSLRGTSLGGFDLLFLLMFVVVMVVVLLYSRTSPCTSSSCGTSLQGLVMQLLLLLLLVPRVLLEDLSPMITIHPSHPHIEDNLSWLIDLSRPSMT